MSELTTIPGTEMNETPEMLAPTMPKATIYQGERRPAVKNVSLSVRLPVMRLIMSRIRKYASTVRIIIISFLYLHYPLCGENTNCKFIT